MVIIYLIVLLVALPLLIFKLYEEDAGDQFKAWFVAGIFVLLTLPIFLIGLMLHIFNYTHPHLQKHIVRILWIVPIYSLSSWLALIISHSAIYWDTIKECYEAYVLYNFLCYLLNYLESEYDLVSELESSYPIGQPPPCCCFPPWPRGKRFIFWCKFGTLQYTVMRLVITFAALVTYWCGVYDKGKINFGRAWIYLGIINGVSQMIAIHALIYFYKGTRKLLGPIRPVWKFISIKAIVFAIFWQAVFIALLVKVGALPESWRQYDVEDVSEGLQNFTICVEMLLFAIAHYFVFSHKSYVDPAAAQAPCITSCLRMLDVRDVADDVREHFVDPIPRPKLPSITRRKKGGTLEKAPLLGQAYPGPSINSDVESAGGNGDTLSTTPRLGNEISSEFSVLTYQDLDPKASHRRLSTVSTEQRSQSVSSHGTTTSTDSGSNGTVHTQ